MLRVFGLAFISKMFAGAGVLLLNISVAFFYGMAGVGHFMTALSIVVGASVLSRLGMDNAIVRDASIFYEKGNNEFLSLAFYCSFFWCGVASLVCVFLAFLMLLIVESEVVSNINLIVPMILSIPFYSAIYLQSSFLKSIGKPAIAPFFETGAVAVFLCAVILGLQFFKLKSISFLGWGFLFGSIFILTIGGGLILRKISVEGRLVKICFTDVVRFPNKFFQGLGSFWVLSANVYLLQWGVILLLGFFLTPDEVGTFTVAHRCALLISFVLIVINGVASPKFSYFYFSGKQKELQSLVSKVFWIGLFFSGTMFLGFCIFGWVAVELFFIEKVLYITLLLIGLSQLVNVLTGPGSYLLMMTGHEKYLRRYMLVFSTVLVFTLIPAAYFGGLLSVVCVFSFLNAMKDFGLMFSVKRYLEISIFPKLQRGN